MYLRSLLEFAMGAGSLRPMQALKAPFKSTATISSRPAVVELIMPRQSALPSLLVYRIWRWAVVIPSHYLVPVKPT